VLITLACADAYLLNPVADAAPSSVSRITGGIAAAAAAAAVAAA
jgi:hypothetical protein